MRNKVRSLISVVVLLCSLFAVTFFHNSKGRRGTGRAGDKKGRGSEGRKKGKEGALYGLYPAGGKDLSSGL